MPQEQSHHPSGPLPLAVALAVVAGFIDAFIYVNVTPVFVANMSGNLVHLGIFLGLSGWHESVGAVVAIVAFVGGVAISTVHHDRQVRAGRAVRPDFLVLVEAGLVLLLPVVLVVFDVGFTSRVTPAVVPVILVGSVAMGIQTSALRRVGAVAVATTYGTGAMVRIGEKAALAARRADRAGNHRRRVTVAVLIAVLVSYVAGAAIAARLGSSPWLLLVPGSVLVVLAVLLRRRGAPQATGSMSSMRFPNGSST